MTTEQAKRDPWTAPVTESLGIRVGHCFSRAGLLTLDDVRRAIEYHKIYDMGGGAYYFYGKDSPSPRSAGPKAWSAALEKLESLGFNWRTHIYRFRNDRWYTTPTKEQQHAEIKEAIKGLNKMLRAYLEVDADD